MKMLWLAHPLFLPWLPTTTKLDPCWLPLSSGEDAMGYAALR
jgi:hypothetical protein